MPKTRAAPAVLLIAVVNLAPIAGAEGQTYVYPQKGRSPQYASQVNQQNANYKRALSVCLSGRGHSVQ